jgi:hypothetical protein
MNKRSGVSHRNVGESLGEDVFHPEGASRDLLVDLTKDISEEDILVAGETSLRS